MAIAGRKATEATLNLSDVTIGNVSTLRHGLVPKLPGGTSGFFRSDGTFAVPPGVGVGGGSGPTTWVNVLAPGGGLAAAAGDGVTDDRAALQAIIDAYPAHTIYFPCKVPDPYAGGYAHASYYLSGPLVVRVPSTILRGDGPATLLQFGPQSGGIYLMAGSCGLHDMRLHGLSPWLGSNLAGFEQATIPAGRALGVTESRGADASDGIRLGAAGSYVSNVVCNYFGRDGINADATDLDLPSGAGFEVGKILLANCNNNRGNGISLRGGDSNVSVIELANCNVNMGWAIEFSPFLGGTVMSAQCDGNFFDSSMLSPSWSPSAYDSITRNGNTATLRWHAVMDTPVFAVGDAVQVITNPDPTLVGRWRVLTVAADKLSLTFRSVGPNTVTAGGSAIWNFMPPEVVPTSITRAATPADVSAAAAITAGSPVVTLATTAGLYPGMTVSGFSDAGTYFPADTIIGSVDSATRVTMRKNAKQSGTFTLGFGFPWSALKTTTVVLPAGYTYNSVGLRIGHGVDIQNCADPSYNGVRILLAVSTDGRTLTYAEPGTAGALAGASIGTLRLAAPADTWAAAGFTGGSFKSAGGNTSYVSWINCYAEGAQPWTVGIGDFVLQPTKSDPITGGGLVLYSSASGVQQPAFSRAVGIVTEDDAGVTASELVGKTQARPVTLYYRDPTVGTGDARSCLWKMVRDAHTWGIITGDDAVNNAALPLILLNRDAGPSFYNTPLGWNMAFQYFSNSGDGIIVGNGTGDGTFTRLSGGNVSPVPITDAKATNNSLFLGLDHLDGAGQPKLCRKDGAGTVTPIG